MARQPIGLTPTTWNWANSLDVRLGILTDDHPAASRGMPVVVVAGQAYGPQELTGITVAYQRLVHQIPGPGVRECWHTVPDRAGLFNRARVAGYSVYSG